MRSETITARDIIISADFIHPIALDRSLDAIFSSFPFLSGIFLYFRGEEIGGGWERASTLHSPRGIVASGRRKKRVRSANSSGALINPTRRAIKESSRGGAGPENRLTLEKHASLKFIYLVQDVSSFHVQHTWIGSSIPLSRQRLSPFPTLYRKYRVSFIPKNNF